MRTLTTALFGLLLVLCSVFPARAQEAEPRPEPPAADPGTLADNFDKPPEKPAFAARRHRDGKPPQVTEGSLQLLSGKGGELNSVAWPRTTTGAFRTVTANFSLTLSPGGRGVSFLLLNTAHFAEEGPAFQLLRARGFPGEPAPAEPEWDEPNLWGSLAVAIDTHNPPSEDPFNPQGNVYDRPQREVSLHWDGRELFNRFCPVEVATGAPIAVVIRFQFVTGGVEASVSIDGRAVYDRQFIAHVMPYESRAGLGAFGPDGGKALIDNLEVTWSSRAKPSPGAVRVTTFKGAWLHPKAGTTQEEFEICPPGLSFERIIMTLRLRPMVDRDEWDRIGWVRLLHEGGHLELARVLTPFMLWGRTYEYEVDVTPFAAMLTGRRRLELFMSTAVNKGFTCDLEFTFYARPADVAELPRALSVQNVWQGRANFKSEDSVAKTYGKRTIMVPASARRATLRVCVTGHGVLEFTPLSRTVRVGSTEFTDKLWTEDCYLNPWRPQFGTWKYDRGGWGPGSLGRIWEVDLSELIKPGEALELEYVCEAFSSKDWAEQVIESCIVFWDR